MSTQAPNIEKYSNVVSAVTTVCGTCLAVAGTAGIVAVGAAGLVAGVAYAGCKIVNAQRENDFSLEERKNKSALAHDLSSKYFEVQK